jgi:hypothetical protein
LRAGCARRPKYPEADKRRAVDHYLDHGRCIAVTIKALSYPSRALLSSWLQELHPQDCVRVASRYKELTPPRPEVYSDCLVHTPSQRTVCCRRCWRMSRLAVQVEESTSLPQRIFIHEAQARHPHEPQSKNPGTPARGPTAGHPATAAQSHDLPSFKKVIGAPSCCEPNCLNR